MTNNTFNKLIKFPENKVCNNDIFLDDIYLNAISALNAYSFANNNDISNIYINEHIYDIGENAFINSKNIRLYINQYKNNSPLQDQFLNWSLDVSRIHFLKPENQIFYNGLDSNYYYYTYDNNIKGIVIIGTLNTNINSINLLNTLNNIPILKIGDQAFKNCSELTSVTLPDGILSIGVKSFMSCASISTITIPSSVTTIEENAFQFCDNLSSIYFMTEVDNSTSIDIVKQFNDSSNHGCGFNNLFKGNFKVRLKNVKCNISSISDSAFYGSQNLKEIQYIWKEDNETVYQNSVRPSNYGEDGILFSNGNYVILADSTSAYTDTNTTWNKYTGIFKSNFIFELKDIDENLISNISSLYENCIDPNRFCDVRLLYATTKCDDSSFTSALTLGFKSMNVTAHACTLLPCFITLFFGRFVGFGKFACKSFFNKSGIRMSLFYVDPSESDLVVDVADSILNKIKVSQNSLDDIRFLPGSLMYEARIGCLIPYLNCMLYPNYKYDTNGFAHDMDDNVTNFLSMWQNKRMGPFKQFLVGYTLGDGNLNTATYDANYGLVRTLNTENNIPNEELIFVGPYHLRWPCRINDNSLYKVILQNKDFTLEELKQGDSQESSATVRLFLKINSSNMSALGEYAFSGNNGISSVSFELTSDNDNFDHLVSFKDKAFASCNKIKSIYGLSNLTNLSYVGRACFNYISDLLSLDFSQSKISTLYDYTFTDDFSLLSIYFPSTLSDIKANVFTGTHTLEHIQFKTNTGILSNANDYFIVDNLSYIINNNSNNSTKYLFKIDPLRIITILNGTASDNSIDLNLSEISADLTFHNGSFMGSTKIKSLTTSDKVTIDINAFNGSTSLTSVTLSNGTTLDEGSFYNLSNLKTLNIYSDIKYKNNNFDSLDLVFNRKSFSNIISVDMSENNTLEYIPMYWCANSSALTTFKMPVNTRYIGNHAFSGCNNLNTINIANLSNLISIDDYAFDSCSAISGKLIIPNKTKNIGDNAFSNCYNITSINIPESVEYIGYNAFSGCSNLSTINIDQKLSESKLATNYDEWGINLDKVTINWKSQSEE